MSTKEINITQISRAIPGLGITGQFVIDTLGVKAARQEKRALFWSVEQWPLICKRLTEHVAKGAATNIASLSGERDAPKAKPTTGADAMFEDDAPAGGDAMFEDEPAGSAADMF